MKISPSNLTIEKLKNTFEKEYGLILDQFFTFLRFSSISSEEEHKHALLACADWVEQYLKKIGFETEVWQTSSHPVIFANYLKAGPDKPTLLIYHHYDVQPVDPLENWKSPPFEPTIRNGQVYARGAQDNKGQCFYTLTALRILLQETGTLPINIKLCIEGEEECGSHGLAEILKQKKDSLKADYLAVVDVGLRDAGTPSVSLGARGIATMDVECIGSHTDMHSGTHGGLAYNPLHALVGLLSKLRDDEGRIAIPHYYDEVSELSPEEKKQITLKFDEQKYLSDFGAIPKGGEKAYSPAERAWVRPTIEINGIHGGYTGAGFKTVIPSKAIAKLSCRLVPHQNPQKAARMVARFLEENAPEGVKVKVNIHPGGGKAVRADLNSSIVKAFVKAFEEVFQAPCEYILDGGSIPIVTELAEASESQVVFVGLGLNSDNIHAPNEHFGLDRLEKGYLVMAKAIELLSKEA